jgi:hypothetical protein
MMSTTGDKSVGQPDYSSLSHLGAPPRDDRQGFIDWQVRSLKAISSPGYPFDEVAVADRAGRAWDRDHDSSGMLRQSVAVLKSGDRTEKLRMVTNACDTRCRGQDVRCKRRACYCCSNTRFRTGDIRRFGTWLSPTTLERFCNTDCKPCRASGSKRFFIMVWSLTCHHT